MSNKEELAEELLSVLRDALGPECRLPKPLTDFARYGAGSVTVRDGRDGAIELTAVLTGEGLIERYSIRLVRDDEDGMPVTAVGPLRTDLAQAPEESPSITCVLPLVIRLDLGGERLRKAQDALEEAGYLVDVEEGHLALREPCQQVTCTRAAVGLDPASAALRVRGRGAAEIRQALLKALVA